MSDEALARDYRAEAARLVANKAVVRRFYDEVFNRGNLAAAEELIAEDFVDHKPFPGQPPGRAGIVQRIARVRAAYPDWQVTIEDLCAEGDRVVTRWTARGTNATEFGGVAPSGRVVTVTGIAIDRIVGGQIAERWAEIDSSASGSPRGNASRGGTRAEGET